MSKHFSTKTCVARYFAELFLSPPQDTIYALAKLYCYIMSKSPGRSGAFF